MIDGLKIEIKNKRAEQKQVTNLEKTLFTLLMGAIGGIGLTVFSQNLNSPTKVARVIEKDGLPKLMKVDNHIVADQILIEDPKASGNYIPLKQYLERYHNENIRNSQEEMIKDLASQGEYKKWYKIKKHFSFLWQ